MRSARRNQLFTYKSCKACLHSFVCCDSAEDFRLLVQLYKQEVHRLLVLFTKAFLCSNLICCELCIIHWCFLRASWKPLCTQYKKISYILVWLVEASFVLLFLCNVRSNWGKHELAPQVSCDFHIYVYIYMYIWRTSFRMFNLMWQLHCAWNVLTAHAG